MNETDPQRPDLEEVRQAIASGDPVQAMPAITKLRHFSDAEAVPLLVLGTEQKPFLVRSLSCSGLGYKRTEQGWTVLSALITADEDPNVRAEAANALASYGVERAWPLLRSAFEADAAWLVRCSILSALAEQLDDLGWLRELATMAIADADGTVRVNGAEILSRIVREKCRSHRGAGQRLVAISAAGQRSPGGGCGAQWFAGQLNGSSSNAC